MGAGTMRIVTEIIAKLVEPLITIQAPRQDAQLEALTTTVAQATEAVTLVGYRQQRVKRIPSYLIKRCYSANKKLYCEVVDEDEPYELHQPLYQVVQLLPVTLFLQISQAEIVRIASIKNFSLTKTGTYQVNLTDGTTTYASRRYTQRLRKEFLK